MERAATAREAVKVMGSLAEEYGYGDGGECLTVSDPKEVWQFEIVGVGKHKLGAAWAAQRIPDEHVGISANIPRIGKIDRSDTENFMASDNLEQVAIDNGLWDGKGDFVFWKVIVCSYAQGRNYREREFRVFDLLAPSLGLKYGMEDFPFSVKPDSLVDVRKVMALLRDTYEGTEWDMCKNWTIDVPEKNGVPAHKEMSPGQSLADHSDAQHAEQHRSGRDRFQEDAGGGLVFIFNGHPELFVVAGRHRRSLLVRCGQPGAEPSHSEFCGSTKLPAAFEKCGQKEYYPNSVLWEFRRANKLATLRGRRPRRSSRTMCWRWRR